MNRMLVLALLAALGVARAQEPSLPLSAVAIQSYDVLRAELVEDDDAGATQAARALAATAPALTTSATAVADAPDLPAKRVAFGELSRALVLGLGSAPATKLWAYRCPMVTGYAYWLQTAPGLANPYMGQAMPACGEGVGLKAAIKAATP